MCSIFNTNMITSRKYIFLIDLKINIKTTHVTKSAMIPDTSIYSGLKI